MFYTIEVMAKLKCNIKSELARIFCSGVRVIAHIRQHLKNYQSGCENLRVGDEAEAHIATSSFIYLAANKK